MNIILLIGPESSGKTTLARQIAQRYQAIYIPEYARLYTELLLRHGREYTYDDVCRIAQHQLFEWQRLTTDRLSQNRTVVFDTECIITQVWFDEVYGHTPDWWKLPYHTNTDTTTDTTQLHFLLTAPDIAWVPDPVRENGSDDRRWYLFHRYEAWLQAIGADYQVIRH